MTSSRLSRATLLRLFALGMHVGSVAIWIPAVLLPVLTIKFGAGQSGIMALFAGAMSQEKTLSILGSIQELWEQEHKVLAALILFFAGVVPLLKTLLLTLGLALPQKSIGQKSASMVFYIGKWAMADVFMVGITIAFMSINSQVMVKAIAGTGLYLFAFYVVLSTLAAQLTVLISKRK